MTGLAHVGHTRLVHTCCVNSERQICKQIGLAESSLVVIYLHIACFHPYLPDRPNFRIKQHCHIALAAHSSAIFFSPIVSGPCVLRDTANVPHLKSSFRFSSRRELLSENLQWKKLKWDAMCEGRGCWYILCHFTSWRMSIDGVRKNKTHFTCRILLHFHSELCAVFVLIFHTSTTMMLDVERCGEWMVGDSTRVRTRNKLNYCVGCRSQCNARVLYVFVLFSIPFSIISFFSFRSFYHCDSALLLCVETIRARLKMCTHCKFVSFDKTKLNQFRVALIVALMMIVILTSWLFSIQQYQHRIACERCRTRKVRRTIPAALVMCRNSHIES